MVVSRARLFHLGQHAVIVHDRFHVRVAASRLSALVNGVSHRHGEESRRIWSPLWPKREVARVPIGHVTNGVHIATWMANRVLTLFDAHSGPDWLARAGDAGLWHRDHESDDAALRAAHSQHK